MKKVKEELSVEKDLSYFHERLDPLGWTPENGAFTTPNWEQVHGQWQVVPKKSADYREETHELFDVDAEGNLVIHYYRITGAPATYRKGDAAPRRYSITRLRVPTLDRKGDLVKYLLPKGAGTFPWFPPRLIEAYRQGTELDALVLTEGALKAYTAGLAGGDVVGLTSITHARDRDKSADQLHQDVIDLIRRCKPKKVVYLVDGDCRDFSRKWNPEDEEGKDVDLYTRPNQFYKSAQTIRDLLQDLSNELGFSMWFKHVERQCLVHTKDAAGNNIELPKGLDDLLLAVATDRITEDTERAPKEVKGWDKLPKKAQDKELQARAEQARLNAHADVIKELNATTGPSNFFYRKSLERLGDVKKYFAVGSAEQFYAEYSDRLKDRMFVFNGTRYQHDGKELVLLMPKEMRNYMRVGDQYYERVPIPNRFGQVEEKLMPRLKTTIIDDHGKEMVSRVQKLKDFCNTPGHEDYQPIIKNCLNRYQPFEHVPEKGEWPHIEGFLKHIFGTGKVTALHPKPKHGGKGEPVIMEVNELDLGYDYLQLLYKKPTQTLPILCLVSQKRETGKSTFAKLLKAIFTGNAAFVSSQDLQSDFNEHWITKLCVICEEAFIEKKATIERIKDLSTASVAIVNTKGVQQKETEVFLKFILCSNNVRNFINTDSDEIRFWVRNVPPIPDEIKNPELEDLMHEEIPAFLHFLGNRSMATEKLSRMWFYPALLETDALRVVREASMPTVRREMESWLSGIFYATRSEELLMTAKDLRREVFNNSSRYDEDYIHRVLKDDMGLEKFKRNGKLATTTYDYYRIVERRTSMMDTSSSHSMELEVVSVKQAARPFVIPRHHLIDDDTWEMTRPDPEQEHVELSLPQPTKTRQLTAAGDDDDLPF